MFAPVYGSYSNIAGKQEEIETVSYTQLLSLPEGVNLEPGLHLV